MCLCLFVFVCLFVFFRALYLMTKRNFKSPGLQHKNKWSENFHDFLRNALQKEPKRRPTTQELLKVRRGGEGGVGEWVEQKGYRVSFRGHGVGGHYKTICPCSITLIFFYFFCSTHPQYFLSHCH